jgi:hypothetical protein
MHFGQCKHKYTYHPIAKMAACVELHNSIDNKACDIMEPTDVPQQDQ